MVAHPPREKVEHLPNVRVLNILLLLNMFEGVQDVHLLSVGGVVTILPPSAAANGVRWWRNGTAAAVPQARDIAGQCPGLRGGRLNRSGCAAPPGSAGHAGATVPKTPVEFEKSIAEETEKWGKVIRAANIKVE